MSSALQRPSDIPLSERLALSKREAARTIGVSERYLELEAAAGRLRVIKAGRRVLIAPVDLEAWLNSRASR